MQVAKIGFLFAFVLIGIRAVEAKCWSMKEIPPTYCVTAQVKGVEKIPSGCVARLKIKKFSIPRADAQALSAASKLKEKLDIEANADFANCKFQPDLNETQGILTASCNDKGQVPITGYEFYPGKFVTTVGNGTQRESISCAVEK